MRRTRRRSAEISPPFDWEGCFARRSLPWSRCSRRWPRQPRRRGLQKASVGRARDRPADDDAVRLNAETTALEAIPRTRRLGGKARAPRSRRRLETTMQDDDFDDEIE